MRNPRLRLVATAATLLAALTAAAACARPAVPLNAGQGGLPPAVNATTAPATTTAPTTPATTKPAATKPATVAPKAGADCTAGSLSYVGYSVEGAMGSRFTTFKVRNHSSVSCRLHGAPWVRYRRSDGSTATLPATYEPGGSVLVPAGGTAGFPVQEPDGFGGYDPHGPQCAHPATYHHLAIVLPGGSTLALGLNGTLSIQCGKFDVRIWGLS
jgi:hypothetical protein